MSDKFISLDSLKEYNKQMKETYIKPLEAVKDRQQKEIEGKVITAIFNITTENTTITLKNLENMTEIDWGDGTVNSELSHTYAEVREYACKIYDVTSIGNEAFRLCEKLTEVVIGNCVTSIGGYVFYSCHSLINVVIPDSVTSIGNDAFSGCDSLTEVLIPDSVTSIGSSAFYCCSSLTSIVISDSITSIGGNAFEGCSSLAEVVIPDSVMNIGRYAFRNCTGLKSVVIPNGVTTIGNDAFYGCSSLTEVVIPDSVTSIGDYAFRGCSSLTSIEIPDSVTTIGWNAFYNCKGLTSIAIPDGAATYYLFDGCTNLMEVIVKQHIPAYSFLKGVKSLNSLTKFYVPRSSIEVYKIACPELVNKIYAIEDMDSNTTIFILDITDSQKKVTLQNLTGTFEIDWDDGSVNSTTNHTYLSTGRYVCQIKGLTSIGENAFNGLPLVGEVKIGEGVTEVGVNAFLNCTGITSVILPNSLTTITNSFQGCGGLKEVTFGKGLITLGHHAFSNCDNLTTVTLPENLETIEWGAFENCDGLEIINIESTKLSSMSQMLPGVTNSMLKLIQVPYLHYDTYKALIENSDPDFVNKVYTPANQNHVNILGDFLTANISTIKTGSIPVGGTHTIHPGEMMLCFKNGDSSISLTLQNLLDGGEVKTYDFGKSNVMVIMGDEDDTYDTSDGYHRSFGIKMGGSLLSLSVESTEYFAYETITVNVTGNPVAYMKLCKTGS